MLLVAMQRRCAALLRDAVVLEVDVREIGEWLQAHRSGRNAVARFGEELLGARAVLRAGAVGLAAVTHGARGIETVPGVSCAGTQRQ